MATLCFCDLYALLCSHACSAREQLSRGSFPLQPASTHCLLNSLSAGGSEGGLHQPQHDERCAKHRCCSKGSTTSNGTVQEAGSLLVILFCHTCSYSHGVIISLIKNENANAAKDFGRVANYWGLPDQPMGEERAVFCE